MKLCELGNDQFEQWVNKKGTEEGRLATTLNFPFSQTTDIYSSRMDGSKKSDYAHIKQYRHSKRSMHAYNNTKIKRSQNVAEPNYSHPNPKNKHRVILNESNRKHEQDTLKNLTRKSIDVTLVQPSKATTHTLYQPSQSTKPYYRRPVNPTRKTGPQRYEDEEREIRENTRLSSKSPYVRMSNSKQEKQSQARVQSLNKSSTKIKSGQLLKQNSPRYLFYRQPRSSLSQHYDPSIETSLHKRRISAVGEEKNSLIEEAKEYYKNNNYPKSIQILKKYIKLHRSSIEGHYLLGMSLINNNEFSLGIEELAQTLELDPNYKRSLYLVIALAYKRLQKYDDAIDILTKGLELYPDYYDCLVYRGKLNLKKDNYYHALKDFTEAININKAKGFAYIGKGVCQKELGHLEEAIETLTIGSKTDMGHVCIEKRGIVYYQQEKYELALQDLDLCTQMEGNQSSTAHYFKGLILYHQGKIIDSLLCFQEALKCDNHRENVTSSVEMMMKIKIEEKDFYEAYHILTRSDNVQVDLDVLNEWRLFLEGSLFLMKKKYKEGINTFESLLSLETFRNKYSTLKNKGQQERYRFLKPLVHLYKGYGELCENNAEKAQVQYQSYQALCSEFKEETANLSKDYNKLLISIYKNFPERSRQTIEEAIRLISNKPEPYLYLAFDIVHNRFEKEPDPIIKNQYLEEAIENLTIGIAHLPQLSNNHISSFYYFRAILHLYRNDFNKAVSDVDKAIEKSEDNIPKYFYLRGLIFAIFGNFSQSVQDLTVAINLDEKYSKPYLERAKCLQIEGNSNEAFLDLQRYITLAPEDQNIHKYAGYLLFQNCAYEDCLSAFSHGAEQEDDYQLMLTRAKCHFLLGEDDLAIPLFKKYCEQSFTTDYQSDITMMQICKIIRKQTAKQAYSEKLSQLQKLLSSKTEQQCKIFKLRDMHQLRGSIYLLMGQYQPAMRQFYKTLELFNVEKTKEREKHFIEDSDQFEDEWSEVQIKFNLSICLLCINDYQGAKSMLLQFQKSSEKGRNWIQYMNLIDDLIQGKVQGKLSLDTFQQNHRISKLWPKVEVPTTEVALSLAFSYPFVEPPELLPEFDEDFFSEFIVSKSERKPEAPWINRSEGGLVFTPNVQVYQNLQLSMASTKKNESERNKPVSEMDRSINMSESQLQLQTEQLKRKFKLDSLVEMKLKKLMKN